MKKYFIDGIVYQYDPEKIKQLPKPKSKEEKKLFIKHFKERDISKKNFLIRQRLT